MGNAVSHASEETLYVCAVAMMIEGGDNCEEGKLAVPLLMWREVEYHILVCGLTSSSLNMSGLKTTNSGLKEAILLIVVSGHLFLHVDSS